MAKEIQNTIRLGIFVTVGIALFTMAVYYIGNRKSLFGERFRISTFVHNAHGLQVGNNVRYAGITVGSVERIDFVNDSTLQVHMVMDDKVKNFIRKDATASIGTDGLVGNVIVNISPGSGNHPPAAEGDTITSFSRLDPNEILSTLGNTNENIALLSLNLLEITEKLNKGQGTLPLLIGDPQMGNDVKLALENLRLASQNISAISEQLRQASVKLSRGEGTLAYLLNDTALPKQMESFAGRLDSMLIGQTEPILADLQKSAADVATSSFELKTALQTLNSGEGLANTLLNDPASAENLRQILENLNTGTARFSENMEALKHNFLFRRYFKKQEKMERKK
jgi:phospholipid/cholesterol/gamma-HCH transport system substrate-binding protein